MQKTSEYQSSIIALVNKAKSFNQNIGNYAEHFLNDDFNFSVKLDNGYAIKISRFLVQDYSKMSSILTENDLINIANSICKIG